MARQADEYQGRPRPHLADARPDQAGRGQAPAANPERAKVVREIINDALRGVPKGAIVKNLNAAYESGKLVRTPQEPVPNYLPALI